MPKLETKEINDFVKKVSKHDDLGHLDTCCLEHLEELAGEYGNYAKELLGLVAVMLEIRDA